MPLVYYSDMFCKNRTSNLLAKIGNIITRYVFREYSISRLLFANLNADFYGETDVCNRQISIKSRY